MAAARKKADDAEARLTIDALMAEINKGDPGAIVRGSDIPPQIPRITSGLPGTDIALGGGWPANQWNEIVGQPSQGKTTLVLWTIACNQQLDPNWTVLWIASEFFVPDWASEFGVDLTRVIVMSTNVMEDAYDVVNKALKNRSVDCIVIDSYPALVSHAEDDQMMAEFAVGIGARQTGKFFRKVGSSGRRSLVEEDRPCTGFLINQWREKIGVMWGDPRTTPGGKAKDFACFTRIDVSKDEDLRVGPKKTDKRVGQAIAIKFLKNKSAPPNRTSVQDFYFEEYDGHPKAHFDIAEQMMSLALEADIIEKRGGWYYYGEEKLGQGRDAAVSRLNEDADVMLGVHKEVWRFHLPHLEPMPLAGWSNRPSQQAPKPRTRRKIAK